ncbi:hypothetical protein GQ43DRAFT_399109 [Delitschia confertaspora ATCC 74209]|uniref:Uncharacterized protein n=1 Tax=Delitschia confertaspora ATCC 74209 TaxID=1513339 RepID=A0A9P4JLD5_9PLEO|nr:hypothetical protein GQ43DRAFT_399109 [Delitschia confertaspora ATCC 74209]
MSHSPSSPSSPFMDGNFDYPPASSSPPTTSGATAHALQRLRRNLERSREEDRARAARERGEPRPAGISPSPRRRPVIRAEAAREVSRLRPPHRTVPSSSNRDSTNDASPRRVPPPPSSTNTNTNRPRASLGSRNLRRARLLREQRSNDMDPADSVDASMGNVFLMANAMARARSPPSEVEHSRREPKRRKTVHEANNKPPYDGFRYGYEGQVVPGRLKMEIVSCDGGEYKEHESQGLYKIQNVLKNDKSVYCTQSSQCNLLLKHIGDTSFALEKVVIKAPDRGFTAPVQEGMVFVSMSGEELLLGTAGYKIEYGSPRESEEPDSSLDFAAFEDEPIPLTEAINDEYIWNNSRRGRQGMSNDELNRLAMANIRRLLDARREQEADDERVRLARRSQTRVDQSSSASTNIPENCDWGESFATAAGVSAPTPPPFTVTTESDDGSDDDQEQPSAAVMADLLRRESRWRTDSEEEEDDDDLAPAFGLMGTRWPPEGIRRRIPLNYSDYLRAIRLPGPSRIAPGAAHSEGLITPHARFFIAKHKNKITINFHPAVSGKYILLKLWSPASDRNIDIESVQFHGYSGPRFFPAIQVR